MNSLASTKSSIRKFLKKFDANRLRISLGGIRRDSKAAFLLYIKRKVISSTYQSNNTNRSSFCLDSAEVVKAFPETVGDALGMLTESIV